MKSAPSFLKYIFGLLDLNALQSSGIYLPMRLGRYESVILKSIQDNHGHKWKNESTSRKYCFAYHNIQIINIKDDGLFLYDLFLSTF